MPHAFVHTVSFIYNFFFRIKEEFASGGNSQEDIETGWQLFKELTNQFSSGSICSQCYLSSFLSLFPDDPRRRQTEVDSTAAHCNIFHHQICNFCFQRRCRLLRELATTCPFNREDLQEAYPPVFIFFLLLLRFYTLWLLG